MCVKKPSEPVESCPTCLQYLSTLGLPKCEKIFDLKSLESSRKTVWNHPPPLLEILVIKGFFGIIRVIKHCGNFAEGENFGGNFAEGEKKMRKFYWVGGGPLPPPPPRDPGN